MDKVIGSDLPVLILGESGTGKEVIAKTIHYNGLRKDRQFVLNYFLHRLTNGLSEGFNSVIRSIQRRANGYRDMNYFALKVYQKAGVLR